MKQNELTAILHAASIFVDVDHERIRANLDSEIAETEGRLATLVAARASITVLMDAEADATSAPTGFTPTMVERTKRHETSLSAAAVIDIRARLDRGHTVQSIADHYGVSRGTISNVKLRKGAYA